MPTRYRAAAARRASASATKMNRPVPDQPAASVPRADAIDPAGTPATHSLNGRVALLPAG